MPKNCNFTSTISGVSLFSLQRFSDNRGCFIESFPYLLKEKALPLFVQDNFAVSKKNVLRGMHFQYPNPQAKLVWVSLGTIVDVIVDMRKGPSFLQFALFTLTDKNPELLFVPEGCAHGYLVLSETAHVHYKVSTPYEEKASHTFRYDDPEIGIPWPVSSPILSAKDAQASSLFSLNIFREITK